MLPKTVVIPSPRGWCEIYDDNMRHLRHGLALWGHKPRLRDIQIGDVGYFSGGKFEFLFSITQPGDPQAMYNEFGTIPFNKEEDVETTSDFIKADELYTSPKVTVVEEIPAEGKRPRKYILNCREKESAVLICFDTPTKTRLKRDVHARWRTYMKKNLNIWYENVHKGWHIFGIELFVLITGTVKTFRWASAAFKGAGKHEFKVGPHLGIHADVVSTSPLEGCALSGPGPGNWKNIQVKDIDPEYARLLPPQTVDPFAHNQCLFVHYLTLSTKWPILTLKAASAPRSLGPPGDEDDDSFSMTSYEPLAGQKTHVNGTCARSAHECNPHELYHPRSFVDRDHLRGPAECSCMASSMSVVPALFECSCSARNALGVPTAIVTVTAR